MNGKTATVIETVSYRMWGNVLMGNARLRRLIRDSMRIKLAKLEPITPAEPRVWRVDRDPWQAAAGGGLVFRLIVGPDAPRYGRQLRRSRKVVV